MFDLSISVSISVTVLLYLGELTMELSHAQRRSTMVNKIWLFGIQLGENPPSVHTYIRTSALHVNACEMSQLLARSPRHIQFVFNVILGIHVMVNWELSHDCIAGPGEHFTELTCFSELSSEKLLVFNWSQAQVLFSGGIQFASCLRRKLNYLWKIFLKRSHESFAFGVSIY